MQEGCAESCGGEGGGGNCGPAVNREHGDCNEAANGRIKVVMALPQAPLPPPPQAAAESGGLLGLRIQ
jgi:hypothetical protein